MRASSRIRTERTSEVSPYPTARGEKFLPISSQNSARNRQRTKRLLLFVWINEKKIPFITAVGGYSVAISISELKGMNPDLEAKLKAEGLGDSEKLLEATKAPADRKALAKKVGAETRDILELANRADLSRIKGVAGVFSDLLEQAGVDTVKELATRRPDNLHAKIKEVNDKAQLAKRIPTLADVESWVNQAKELPKLLTY